MAPHQVCKLEGNKWIAFVDTEALSLKLTNDLDGLATTEAE
jgi:hypothetical protein